MLINVDDASHAALKRYAAEHGTTMSAVLRAALSAYLESPPADLPPDARTRGAWYVRVYLWGKNEDLIAESGVCTIASTGELPALAASLAERPELAELVRADLPRFRQVLARVQSSSMRIPFDNTICQVDVYREHP